MLELQSRLAQAKQEMYRLEEDFRLASSLSCRDEW